MMKAKEFLDYLCDNLNYRFFSGVPVEGFKGLFKAMSSDKMHYIPAANENIALALANGVSLLGVNSAIMIEFNKINELVFENNILYDIPILIIAFCSKEEQPLDFANITMLSNDIKNDLESVFSGCVATSKPRIICFKEGQLI